MVYCFFKPEAMTTKSFAKQKVAVFDLDGTIFRSTLHFELLKGLVQYGIFPFIVLKEIKEYHDGWVNRRGHYRDFEQSLITSYKNGIKNKVVDDIQKVSRYIVEEKREHIYVYTRDLIERLRNEYILLAISGSPREVVDVFTDFWKFDRAYDTEYESKDGVYTGEIVFPAYNKKREILEKFCSEHHLTLEGSIGIGDTAGDVAFLEMVTQPIAFNPSRELYDIAKERKWKIVVERKDMIYEQ